MKNSPLPDLRGDWFETPNGDVCAIRVPSDSTGGLYSLTEIVSQVGDGTPLHLHENEDEFIFVIEGTARIARGDEIFDVKAGEVAKLPKGVAHAWGNRADVPLRVAFVAMPGGCEQALRQIAEGSDPREVAGKFNIQGIGPTPF
jgi:mannose-6-phosphate isomerase-like protein (cupin superfamily)